MNGHLPGGGGEHDLLDYDGLVPEELTSFVGRDEETRSARALVLGEQTRPQRLVTLVGIGGVGKSRLLEHLAGELGEPQDTHVAPDEREDDHVAFPDGITLVRLADVPPKADVIASTIAHRAQLLDNASESALARLIKHFQGKRALLLLDNCEQLVVDDGPLPRLLNVLLRSTKSLCMVATSQVKLGAVGERVINVPPLRGEEALQVLLDRAAAIDQPIVPAEYPLARRLCEATDGIPLAIELAAGQLDVLGLQDLVDRAEAEDLLSVLVDGTSEQRHHRTMAGSIARSYELLSDTDQQVFALLSVFRGFDLDAAAAVASHFDVDPNGIGPIVVRLARRSLLVAETHDGRKRFRMVEIIRQFAQQRVRDRAIDIDALCEAHNTYFLEFGRRARREWFGTQEPQWMRGVIVDLPNYRTVQQRLLDRPDTAPLGLELAVNVAVTRALVFGGRLNEIRRMLEGGLAAHPLEPSLGQVAALSLTLWVAVLQGGRQELASSLLEQFEKAARHLDCWETFGPVLYARGVRIGLGAPNAAQAREALDLLARAETAFGNDGVFGDEFMAALFGAIIQAFAGDKDAAFASSRRLLAMARAARSQWCISWALWVRALTELMHGDDPGVATRRAQEALAIQREIGDRWGPTWSLWLLALCAINDREYTHGALLLGGANREQITTQTSVTGLLIFLRAQQKFVAIARNKLGDTKFEDLVAAGFAMESDELFKLALPEEAGGLATPGGLDGSPRTAARIKGVLSERELEVAQLVAQGKTNGEIAAALVLSERTVEGHVGNINGKLGTRNRTEITAYVMKHLDRLA